MEDFDKAIQKDEPVLVDFFATWCGPCRAQKQILEEVKRIVGDSACIMQIDIDADRALASRFRVQSVPTLMVFRKGELLWRASGVQPSEMLVRKLEEYRGG